MSNLNLSGKEILRFLNTHYEFVHSAFAAGKPHFMIDSDKFMRLLHDYNAKNESKISLYRLTSEVKFCRQLSTGEYKLNRNYIPFLEYLFNDFVLNLPETLKNRYQAVFNHFNSLKDETSSYRIILLTQEIINVIEDFLSDIEGQTQRLLRDTEALKVNVGNHSAFSTRIQRANFWIDEYIIPLNAILDKDRADSIVNMIIKLQQYSNEKRLLSDNYELKLEFEKLYACAVNAKSELDRTLSKLTRELLPLLERIKSDSIILNGFYHFVENIDDPKAYIAELPHIVRRTKSSVTSKSFAAEAEFYIDQFSYLTPEILFNESEESIEWLPDAGYFKEQLLKEDGVKDFYKWCLTSLEEQTDTITLSKFFTLTNMLLDEDLVVEYKDEKRQEIKLADATLLMPKIKVYAKLSK
jgi:hypothetical protein